MSSPRALSSPTAAVVLREGGVASSQLLCFPPAAGGASLFRHWPAQLPHVQLCAIQLPGHESRIQEPPAVCMDMLVEQIARDIRPLLRKPFSLYGHSMGALLAFEVAHRIRTTTGHNPAHLFVSAARPPQAPQLIHRLHDLPDEAFLREVHRYGLLSQNVMQCAELMLFLTPLLRGDLRLCDAYRYVHRPPLACPITAIGCLNDAWVPVGELSAWQGHTTDRFERVIIEGGHELGSENSASCLSIIRTRLLADGRGAG